MRIAEIRATPFTLPLKHEMIFASGRMTVTEHVLIELFTDDGLIGIAEAVSRPMIYGETQSSIVASLREFFAPILLGRDIFELDRIWDYFRHLQHNNTVKGALDIALHDLIGQAAGVSCRRLLGGWADNIDLTYMCGMGEPEAIADEALAANSLYGINSFKLKTGIELGVDLRMMRAVREALPEALLYVDVNQGYTLHQARTALALAAELNYAWAEEPCATHDRIGRREIARVSGVPVMGDESCRTLDEVAREIADDAVHMVSIKTARTGFRLSQQIMGACAGAAIRPLCGSQGDSGVGMIAIWHFCAAHRATQVHPAEIFFPELVEDILAEPFKVEAGKLRLPEEPGLGIRIDPDRLKRFQVGEPVRLR